MAEEIIARLGVKVTPDTTGLSRDLRNTLRRIEEKERLEVPLKLKQIRAEDMRDERNKAQARIDAAKIRLTIPVVPRIEDEFHELRGELRELKRKLQRDSDPVDLEAEIDTARPKREWAKLKKDLSGDKVELKVDVDRQGRARAQLAALSRNRIVSLFVRVNKRSLATAAATLEALSGVALVRRLGRGIENFLQNIDKIALRVGKLGTIVGVASSAALSATSALAGVMAGLGQLGGYALFLPNAAASITAFVAVGVAAFKDFGDAVAGDAKALDALPPKAARAARALAGTWTSIQKPTQMAFWNEMGDSLVHLVREVLPEVRTGMTLTGASVGRFSRRILDAFTVYGGTGMFEGMFSNLAKGISNASEGANAFVDGIIRLGSVGSTFLPRVGTWLEKIATQFNRWVRRSEDTGKLQQWMQNAATSAHDLGRFLIGVKGSLSAITGAARRGGAGDLGTLADATERLRVALSGRVVQDALSTLFGGAHTGIAAAKSGLKELGHGIAVIAPTLSHVLATSGIIVQNVFSSLGDAIKSPVFREGLTNFFTGLSTGLEGFLRWLPNVVDGVGDLASLFGTVFDKFLPLTGRLLGELSDTFRDLKPSIDKLVPSLVDLLDNGLGMLFSLINGVGLPALKGLMGLFSLMPTSVQSVLGAMLLLKRFTKADEAGGSFVFSKKAFGDFKSRLQAFPALVASAYRTARDRVAGIGIPAPEVATPQAPQFARLRKAITLSYQNAITGAMQTAVIPAQRAMTGTLARVFSVNEADSTVRRYTTQLGQKFASSWQSTMGSSPLAMRAAQVVRGTISQAFAVSTGFIQTDKLSAAAVSAVARATAGKGNIFKKKIEQSINTALAGNPLRIDVANTSDLARRIIPSPLAMRSALDTSVNKAQLGDAIGRAFQKNRVELTPWRNAFESLSADTRVFFARTATTIQSTMAGAWSGIKAGATATWGSIKSGLRGLWSFIGGGWGAAFMGAMLLFSKMQQQADQVKAMQREVQQAAKESARAAIDAGQEMFGPAAASRAIDYFDTIKGKIGGEDGWLAFFGGGQKVSLESYMQKAGISQGQLVDYMTGAGDAGVSAFLKSVRDKQAADKGSIGNWLWDWGGSGTAAAEMKVVLDQIEEFRVHAVGELTKIWNDPNTRPGAIASQFEAAQKSIASGGKTTIANFQKTVDKTMNNAGFREYQRTLSNTSDSVALFAEGAANALGGVSEESAKFKDIIVGALLEYGSTAEQINKHDYISGVINSLKMAGVPIANIKQMLGELGYESEEAARKIDFSWGVVANAMGSPILVGGELVPKLNAYSGGVYEVANALAAVAGVNPKVLADVFRANGMDFKTLGADLAIAGLGYSEIKTVLEELGFLPAQVADQLNLASTAARNLVNNGMANTKRIDDFAAAIKEIRDAAEDAATTADALFLALDKLQGGDVSAFQLAGQLQSDILGAVDNVNQLVKDKSPELKGALKNGLLNPLNQAGIDIGNSLISISQNALKVMLNAYQTATDAGAGPKEAMAAAMKAMGPYAGQIDKFFQQLVKSGVMGADQVKEVQRQLGLLPMQQELLIKAQTTGAQGELATVALQASSLAKGVYSVTVEALSDEAKRKLESVGATVVELTNGTKRIFLGADDTSARNTLAGILNTINGSTASVRVKARFDGLPMSRMADGGIMEFFKNGGIRNGLARMKSFANGSERHVAQIAPAGTWRIWAEPETGGEAYIPLSPAKRARSLEILSAVANRFGYMLERQTRDIRHYANGSADSTQHTSSAGVNFNITNINPVAEKDSRAVARAARLAVPIGP